MKAVLVVVGVILAIMALMATIFWIMLGPPSHLWFGADRTIEVKRAGDTFTLIGHCEGSGCSELDVELNNKMTRKAGRICSENELKTKQVAKIGDQRYVVICE